MRQIGKLGEGFVLVEMTEDEWKGVSSRREMPAAPDDEHDPLVVDVVAQLHDQGELDDRTAFCVLRNILRVHPEQGDMRLSELAWLIKVPPRMWSPPWRNFGPVSWRRLQEAVGWFEAQRKKQGDES